MLRTLTIYSLGQDVRYKAFLVLVSLILFLGTTNFYFLSEAVHSAAGKGGAEEEFSSLSSKVSALESEYLKLSKMLTMEEAENRGLVASSPIIVYTAGKLTLDSR